MVRLEDCCLTCVACSLIYCRDLYEFCNHENPLCHSCCYSEHMEVCS